MTVPPVDDWATDYDIFDPGYVDDPFPVWDQLRATCPVAHTPRWGGSWLPTRYDDVAAIAHDVEHFSSRHVGVLPPGEGEEAVLPCGLPPISADPPEHTWSRRLLLPWFSHARVAEYEIVTRELCRTLVEGLLARGRGDAATDYAQQIPVRVIANVLGVPGELADTFTGWVRDVLEFAHDQPRRNAGRAAIVAYFTEQMAVRRVQPGEDLISALLHSDVDGQPVPDSYFSVASNKMVSQRRQE
jgi:cytochrome P450